MKKLILSISLLAAVTAANAQTYATNWTATDCNSVSHTLFNTLDSGKIIVFIWVMPCASCKNGAKAAYDAVQSFATSHPGKVRMYLADDLGDASCSGLSSWVSSNSVGSTANMTIFSNAGNVIDENDFGGTGMPHVIVMGGTDHNIYYNKKGSLTNDLTGITAAVNTAMSALSVGEAANNAKFSVLPNPANDVITVEGLNNVTKIDVVSVSGKTVRIEKVAAGKTSVQFSLSGLASGMYLVKATDINGNTSIQKLVKQ
ncbi:MAG: T9SS type A sorting domain-containing protein [Chitinophagaceae bacterium]|nr:T9SS type A sorting domain-containing protein [Chitinophagaceae bacterium]